MSISGSAASAGETKAILEALTRDVAPIAEKIIAATLTAIPKYVDYENELRQTTPLTLLEFVNNAQQTDVTVSTGHLENARRRAQQGFDGDAIARAWRIVIRQLWKWLTEECDVEYSYETTGIALWGRFMEISELYVDGILNAFFETLQARSFDDIVSRGGRFESLLSGEPDMLRTGEELAGLGVLAAKVRILVCELPPGVTGGLQVAEALPQALKLQMVRIPWTLRDSQLVVCLPVSPGGTRLLQHISALPENLRLGLSAAAPCKTNLADLLAQAKSALRMTSSQKRLADYSELTLIQRIALRTAIRHYEIPGHVALVLSQLERHAGWVETVQALMAADGNTKAAANLLHIHQNTLYYRLSTISEMTGQDLRSPRILADLFLAVSCGALEDPGSPRGS